MDFYGTVVLIVGASSGIGKTLATILHNYGATVIGTYYQNKITDVTYETCRCNINNENEVKELIEYIKNKHEKLDLVVNASAISIDKDIYDMTKEDFMKVLETNLVGTFLVCKYASLIMDSGVIINISSTDATDTFSTISMNYSASKAGVENLTKNLANRFPKLRICAIAPNWVNTQTILDMDEEYLKQEMARIGQKKLIRKEEVALKIIEMFLNSDYTSGEIVRMSGESE